MRGDGERGWADLVREVGEAFLALLRAEVEALVSDFGRSGRALGRALALAAGAGAVLFWALALVIYVVVELLALVLPRWGAAAATLGIFLLAAGILVAVARARWRAIEDPVRTVRRRVEDSRRWWRSRPAADDVGTAGRPGDAIEEELP